MPRQRDREFLREQILKRLNIPTWRPLGLKYNSGQLDPVIPDRHSHGKPGEKNALRFEVSKERFLEAQNPLEFLPHLDHKKKLFHRTYISTRLKTLLSCWNLRST
jgi:hypothetical protein